MAQLSLEQQADLASIFYEMCHNPQTRPEVAKVLHKINPQRAKASFPDVVQQEQFRQLKREIREELDLNGTKAAKERVDAQRAALKDRYSDDEIAKIEQVADEIGTHDYESAAIIYGHRNPAPDPRDMPPDHGSRPGARWEFPTVQAKDGKPMDFKSFVADPNKYAIDAAYNVIGEFKRQSLPGAFRR